MFGNDKKAAPTQPAAQLPPVRAFVILRINPADTDTLEEVTVQAHEITVTNSGALAFVLYKLDDEGDVVRHWPRGFAQWLDYEELEPSRLAH